MRAVLIILSVVACAVAGPPVSRSRDEIESFKAFLDRSRQDDGVLLESRMLENPKASVWENSGKYQGDILLDDDQAESLLQQYAEGRNAWIVANTRWPQNTVVFEFANQFTQAQINAITAAMNEIQARTCIRFRRRTNEANFVRITGANNGCYASVGFRAGVSTFNLALNTPGRGCFAHTVIIHEWLHVVGFLHMQSTHNRDTYVRIYWQNIQPGMAHNFDRYGSNLVSNLNLPYEYASNLHYGRYGFSVNGQPTMLPIFNDNNQMGQQQVITNYDWLRANRHYNCPGAWSDELNAEELSKGEYLYEIATEEDVVLEEKPQEEVVPEEVSFVEDAQ